MSPVSVFGSRLVVVSSIGTSDKLAPPEQKDLSESLTLTNLRDLSFADVLSLKRIVVLSLVAFRDLAVFYK